MENEPCGSEQCPFFGQWAEWSECSVSCGSGRASNFGQKSIAKAKFFSAKRSEKSEKFYLSGRVFHKKVKIFLLNKSSLSQFFAILRIRNCAN